MEENEEKTQQSAPESRQEPSRTPDGKPSGKKPRHHLIKITWLRRTLKTLGCLILFVIILPFLLYIPPIQTFVKNQACRILYNSTGMKVEIEKFRLKFPLDVSLQGLSVVEASGDTMVKAREAIADVKLLPLLKLDVDVNKLRLEDAYYRLVAADTSMIMTLKAGMLEVDDKSSMNIKKNRLLLNKASLSDADITMYMDVWRKKPTPTDTTGQMVITINELTGKRIRFGMSMLPTIDTLSLYTDDLRLEKGVINLEDSHITAEVLSLSSGDFTYLTPTQEYIDSHPVPVDTMPPAPPMVIEGKSVSLTDFNALYAIAGNKPLPGFDAGYIQVSDVNIRLQDLYNAGPTLRLPIKSMQATERCGLQITEGSGEVALDSLGINIDNLRVLTPYSNINLTAGIPFALMEMQPTAPVNINGDLSLGVHDINAFMPSLESFTQFLPQQQKIKLLLEANGTLSDLDIPQFDLAIPTFLSLRASGFARDPFDIKNMVAAVDIDGSLHLNKKMQQLVGDTGFDIPDFTIKGEATANHQAYGADLALKTSQGDLAAKGKVNLNSETYNASLSVNNLNVAYFVPDLGVGKVTATLKAVGQGFNPIEPRASTDIDLDVASIEYNKHLLRDVILTARLADHDYDMTLRSANPELDVNMALSGSIFPDDYSVKGHLNCYHIDLQSLGLDTTMNNGNFDIYIDGTASPERWLYDLTLHVNNLDWNLPDEYIHMPQGIDAKLLATENSVDLDLDCQQTGLKFTSSEGLQTVIDKFTKAADVAVAQINNRELIMDSIQGQLPKFDLSLHSPGQGLLDQFLGPSGISLDTVFLNFRNDSILTGHGEVLGLMTPTMEIDTITLGLSQRNSLLDYRIHIGNQPGTMDEFHQVNLNGYIGSNRVSAYLNQQNVAGETGYRIGLTAALMDSTLTVHFTPLKAMIGYRPWSLNSDNYIDLNTKNFKIDANLEASSNESAILLETRAAADNLQELHLKLTNIHVQDFLQMSVTSPSLTATVNSDIRARYDGKELVGIGKLGITDFTYDNIAVADLNLGLNASMDESGTSDVAASLKVNGNNALTFSTKLISGEEGLQPEFVKLNLDKFPLDIANAFLGQETAQLSGTLSGDMDLTGTLASPLLNGYLQCDSVAVYLPIMGSSLRLGNEPLTVKDNFIRLNNFEILGANSNPLTIDGSIDATTLTDIALDITARANNFQLVNNDSRAGSDLYGKLFLNLNASAKGPLTHFVVEGNLNVLGATDVYYSIPDASTAIQAERTNDVVRFVNLSDTATLKPKEKESVFMRVNATLSITPGAMVTVNLSNNGTDRVQLSPSGSVNFNRNFMGDMSLNGQLTLGQGFARYNVPVIGEKQFDFDPASYVSWNGAIMNPNLNIKATDQMKVSVVQTGGNSHLVNFLVGLSITNNLSSPKILFDLSTNDDIAIENQLQGMTADQRNSTAMNLLITGQYSNADFHSTNDPVVGNVYNFLAQQVNSWAAKNIRGVDLTFGVDQFDRTIDGQNSSATSYSYQVSKSLFNNRFKINVGGNYTTDASADDNLTQNLISDISFEYILRQTQSQTMYVKLFRHNGYESILEGEITEMGVGFGYKRKIGDIKGFFRLGRRKRPMTQEPATVPADTLQNVTPQAPAGKEGGAE